ncbi:MAG: putative transcriptional regulator [Gallionellaceae bacterium]|nr:MAG: putative transcriptional regulator [Gallionellaceae bacterium]
MVVELYELDISGRLPVLEVARRMESALDVEKTTKRFFTAYQEQHGNLLAEIEGIDDERDRRWYASVILNRLMFVWFMQKKGFLDGGDYDYLPKKFAGSQKRGQDRFFGEFLAALFFEAFAKPEGDRTAAVQALTGDIPYLNGGLFLHHTLELDANKQPRLGATLRIPDRAFDGVFKLFASFSWNLDDTPGGNADEINPDVLGYIFEKYINQKAFGAYYTRPEITHYLAERSIHKLILERIHQPAVPELGFKEVRFDSVPDMLAKMDNVTALRLVHEVLPAINILDPAVGSGAFLVAALKVLINIYSAVVGRAELGGSDALGFWLKKLKEEHPSIGYYIKRSIVTDNLYGADIMQEATEIAKLRLFLSMVASVRKVEELEPLPNIDFNILPGNSLVGLMRVDDEEFGKVDHATRSGETLGLFTKSYKQLLEEKNRKLETYRHSAGLLGRDVNLRYLRDDIDENMNYAKGILNELLRDQFEALGVKYEQATLLPSPAGGRGAGGEGEFVIKFIKRKIATADIAEQTPLHWGYVFDEVMHQHGGFDIILTNPPWEIFKPQAKEFFADHSGLVSKNKMTIKEFEKEQGKLLKDKAVRDAWLEYESRFPHMSGWFRAAPEYRFQSAVVNGKKTGSDINLYKLFVERCFGLLRPGGHCGIVIPSGIYTDLGAKGLRDLLFDHSHIEGLFCFENRKTIFEGVDSRFKFVVLTFEKSPPLPQGEGRGGEGAMARGEGAMARGEGAMARGEGAMARGEGAKVKKPTHTFVSHPTEKLSKVPPDLLQFARSLRSTQTDAENLMWALLRDRRLMNCKFRRQHPVAPYVLDFYCAEYKLAVELDGGQHNESAQQQKDERRTAFLQQQGIRVLRFWNSEVLGQTESVLEAIYNELAGLTGGAPSPLAPLPEGEGDKNPSPSLTPTPSQRERELSRGRGEGVTLSDTQMNPGTTRFPAAFMRHDVAELDRFPSEGALWLDIDLIRQLSPDGLLVMEFKSELDLVVVQKLYRFPRIKEAEKIGMNVKFVNEFHMTNDSHLFSTTKGINYLPLYEGSTFWQFEGKYAEPRYFLSAADVEANLPIRSDGGDWKTYLDIKLAVRLIASTTNERTLISSAIPASVVSNHNVGIIVTHGLSEKPYLALLYLMALLNSFALDWLVRMEGATYIKFSSLYRLPVPPIGAIGRTLSAIVTRAARLICTTPEFDDLAREVGLVPRQRFHPHPNPLPQGEGILPPPPQGAGGEGALYGATEPLERARLRAELDGLIAHLYGLTEAEFAHILTTFPLVPDPVKLAALNAYRDVERGLVK